MIQTGNTLGLEILSALGMDKKLVKSVGIDCQTNEAATVTIVRMVSDEEAAKIVEELRSYALYATGGTVAPARQVEIVNRTSEQIDPAELARAIAAHNLTRSAP